MPNARRSTGLIPLACCSRRRCERRWAAPGSMRTMVIAGREPDILLPPVSEFVITGCDDQLFLKLADLGVGKHDR